MVIYFLHNLRDLGYIQHYLLVRFMLTMAETKNVLYMPDIQMIKNRLPHFTRVNILYGTVTVK